MGIFSAASPDDQDKNVDQSTSTSSTDEMKMNAMKKRMQAIKPDFSASQKQGMQVGQDSLRKAFNYSK